MCHTYAQHVTEKDFPRKGPKAVIFTDVLLVRNLFLQTRTKPPYLIAVFGDVAPLMRGPTNRSFLREKGEYNVTILERGYTAALHRAMVIHIIMNKLMHVAYHVYFISRVSFFLLP